MIICVTNIFFEGTVKLRVEIRFSQVLYNKIHITVFGEPFIESFVAHTYSKRVDSQKSIGIRIITNRYAFGVIIVLPVEMSLILPWFGEHPAIGLIFDIQEFGRIEPVPRVIGHTVPTNGLGNGLTHHSSRVPNGFNGSAVTNRLMLFGTISDGINIGDIGFQVAIDLNTTPGLYIRVLNKIETR